MLCLSHGCISLSHAVLDHVEALLFMDFPDDALTNFYVLVIMSHLRHDVQASSPGV